jgi:hypothetical protein
VPISSERVPSKRWAAEFVLILVSVYLAVFLEGWSQRRQDHAAAVDALAQLKGELQEDLADFDRIIAMQKRLTADYENLARWLSTPRSAPSDSVGSAVLRIGTENLTLFPRRSSWNTMISAGQLADLNAPELVLRLGQLYETIYTRIDYNSRFYDEDLQTVLRGPAIKWTGLPDDPLRYDGTGVEQLAQDLERLHVAWNVWYHDLLVDYQDDVSAALEAVNVFLAEEGV